MRLSPKIEQALYRVFQEALANIARHGNANCVQVNLGSNLQKKAGVSKTQEGRMIYLEINDDGCGFDTNKVSGGVGLRSMRERIEALNGVLNIVSNPGRGTRIEVNLSGF